MVFFAKGGCVCLSKKASIPEYHPITEFLRGQSSKIFDDIAENDKIVIVNKHSRPQNVIISYERYEKLLRKGESL